MKKYTIDVRGKSLGRSASHVAHILRGKDTPQFMPHKAPELEVYIQNVDDLKLSANKLDTKVYIHHSGYPGGQKKNTMRKVIGKHGAREVFRRAVYGMLSSNKLRDQMMKNIIFE